LTVGLEAHVFDMNHTDGFLPHYNDWGKCGQMIGRNTNIIEFLMAVIEKWMRI